MLELNKLLQNLDLSQGVRTAYEKELKDLVGENMKLQDQQLQGAVGYTTEDKQNLINISNKKGRLLSINNLPNKQTERTAPDSDGGATIFS